jgi:hypothetical protein
MDIISAGIIGLLFIGLIVACVLAAKTWHWVNIVFLVLTFLTAVGATIAISQVFQKRYDAMTDAKQAEELLKRNEEAADLAIFGRSDSVVYDRDSLRGINQEVSLVMTGRGRVWSAGQVTAEGDQRVFRFASPRPADDTEQVKLKEVLLYAFADGNVVGQLYPQSYIGTVIVSEESPESLKLQPMFIANGAEWATPSSTWSLFEKMPLDRRGIFKDAIVAYVNSDENALDSLKQLAEGIQSDNLDVGLFREALMQNYLPADRLNLDPNSAEYEKLIDKYAFDGMPLGKIQNWIESNAANRISQRFEPSPEEVFIEYRFDENSNRAYQVDADGSLETDGAFTPLGQAIEKSLHAGKDIDFEKGDTVLVDQLSAQGYQRGTEQVPPFSDQETVTEIDRVYLRQLRDFPYMLADLYDQTSNFIEETDRVRQNNAVQDKALADAEAQLQDRLNTTAGLEMDNANLKTDLDTVNASLERKTEQNLAFKAKIQSLMSEIMKRYQEVQEKARQAERRSFASGR